MILPPLVMAVSLGPGAFEFSTRIKGGGRKGKRKIAEDLSPCGKIGVKRQEGERS